MIERYMGGRERQPVPARQKYKEGEKVKTYPPHPRTSS